MSDKKTIFLALGHVELENYLKQNVDKDYDFLGETVYREGILKTIRTLNKIPDILIIRETLPGNTDIMEIVYEIRKEFPKTRIIFLAGDRSVGDKLLKALVDCGVYDILYGASLYAPDIITLIYNPNSFKDVAYLQGIPKFSKGENKEVDVEISPSLPPTSTNFQTEPQNPSLKTQTPKFSIFQSIKKPKTPSLKKDINETEEEKSTNSNLTETQTPDKKPSFIPTNTPSVNEKNKKTKEKLIIDKKRLIVFIGAKHGLGTTQISFNTAIALAEMGNKTLYIEYDKTSPQISYLLDKWKIKEGIDSAMNGIKEGNPDEIEQGIIKNIGNSYPSNLDLMFFSKSYIAKVGEEVDERYFKEFLMETIHSLDYDKIIVDYSTDINSYEAKAGLRFGDIIFSVLTQEPSTIGYFGFKLNEIKKEKIEIEKKHVIIINKYIDNTKLNTKAIGEWLNNENIITIGDYSKEIIESNLSGEALYLNKKSKTFIKEIEEITNKIIK